MFPNEEVAEPEVVSARLLRVRPEHFLEMLFVPVDECAVERFTSAQILRQPLCEHVIGAREIGEQLTPDHPYTRRCPISLLPRTARARYELPHDDDHQSTPEDPDQPFQ